MNIEPKKSVDDILSEHFSNKPRKTMTNEDRKGFLIIGIMAFSFLIIATSGLILIWMNNQNKARLPSPDSLKVIWIEGNWIAVTANNGVNYDFQIGLRADGNMVWRQYHKPK